MKTMFLTTATALLLCLTLIVSTSTHGAPTVTQVSSGNQQTLFVLSDGSLWGMGGNTSGELGLGFNLSVTNVPQRIVASNVTAVAAGYDHSHFLRSDGSLWAMGANDKGQLGDGTTNGYYSPRQIVASGVTAIAGARKYSLFRTVTGHLPFLTTGFWGMGDNYVGALGDGTYGTNQLLPELLQNTLLGTFNDLREFAAGAYHSLYRRVDGSLWGTGFNGEGELGDGTQINRFYPVEIVTNGVSKIAAGWSHSLFIKSDGGLWAMGNNFHGQLGDDSTVDGLLPEQVGVNVTAIAAGVQHSLFIKSDSSLWAMGDNRAGQLGDGTTTERHVPVQIVSSNVIAVVASMYHSLFIKSDGTLWAMGENDAGQLGDGTYTSRYSPVQVFPLVIPQPGITNIALAGTNVVLTGTNGQSGRTYFTLMSTNLGQPLNQWARVATSVLGTDGNFRFVATNVVTPNARQRFYILQVK